MPGCGMRGWGGAEGLRVSNHGVGGGAKVLFRIRISGRRREGWTLQVRLQRGGVDKPYLRGNNLSHGDLRAECKRGCGVREARCACARTCEMCTRMCVIPVACWYMGTSKIWSYSGH